MGQDYEVQFKIRNGHIVRRMKELGIGSVAELARIAGCNYGRLVQMLSLKLSPRRPLNGEWRDIALSVSAALKVMPDDLWTERQQVAGVKKNTAAIYMDEDQLQNFLIDGMDAAEARLTVQKLISGAGLNEREKSVVMERMAGGACRDVGAELNICGARVQQIEAKAIRKMKAFAARSRMEW